MGNSTGARWRYVVRVDFLSDGDPFARETYMLAARRRVTAILKKRGCPLPEERQS